jgi:hypothetical protein
LYADSSEDSIYVYDLRCGIELTGSKNLKAEAGHRRFRLDLPPIDRPTTSRYIQIRRNPLPMRVQDQALYGDGGGVPTPPSPPPFYGDPHERLVVLRIATSPVDFGEEQFELHVPAQALLEHFAVKRDAGAVVPWSVWRADTAVTPPRRLPYLPQSRMITYGMRTVSHPPDWDEDVSYLYSYTSRKAGAVSAGSGAGTRQGIPLPDESPENLVENANLFSILCEDGLLFYRVMSASSRLRGGLTDA